MRREFAEGVARHAAAVTTEISQLPLSGVEWMLDAAEPGSPVSFCGLPHDPDGPFRALIFAWLALAPLVLAGLWGMFRRRSANGILVVGVLLMVFAWVRLIALTPTC